MAVIAELKPCPFCGSLGVVVVGSFVRCGNCGAVGPYGLTQADAAERWNHRASLPARIPISPVAPLGERNTVETEEY